MNMTMYECLMACPPPPQMTTCCHPSARNRIVCRSAHHRSVPSYPNPLETPHLFSGVLPPANHPVALSVLVDPQKKLELDEGS